MTDTRASSEAIPQPERTHGPIPPTARKPMTSPADPVQDTNLPAPSVADLRTRWRQQKPAAFPTETVVHLHVYLPGELKLLIERLTDLLRDRQQMTDERSTMEAKYAEAIGTAATDLSTLMCTASEFLLANIPTKSTEAKPPPTE